MRQICLLGATGSIGSSTLDLIRRHPGELTLKAVTAYRSVDELVRLCREFAPELAVVADPEFRESARRALSGTGVATRLESGPEGLLEAVALDGVDTVVAGIVGSAGLAPTLAAVRAGHRVLLANKEALVMTGELFMGAARESGALVMPVDSEHNAIFQCLPRGSADGAGIETLVLTASGGPFRSWDAAALESATPAQACDHPTWSMGRKISVDSATLMNKGLEVIEAHYLFGLSQDRIRVLIHPESIVHGMVNYADGSTLAQMGTPDMRTPIASGLFWPRRLPAGVEPLDLVKAGTLSFHEPDTKRFPCLALARRALEEGGTAPAVLNAANESAVQFFLDGRIGFMEIARINARALDSLPSGPADSVEAVLEADSRTREQVVQWVKAGPAGSDPNRQPAD